MLKRIEVVCWRTRIREKQIKNKLCVYKNKNKKNREINRG